MNDDFANSVIYISENLNRLADQASPHLYGMYKDAFNPLGIEDVMEVRRILNEYNAQAYLLNLKIKELEEARNKKSFLKKLFKRKN